MPRLSLGASKRFCLLFTLAWVTAGCAKPKLVWTHPAEPLRSFDGDDQECQIVAQALTSDMAAVKPILRLTLQNREWQRCMGARGWQLVEEQPRSQVKASRAVASENLRQTPVLVDTGAPVDTSGTVSTGSRWRPLFNGSHFTVAMDTTRITEVNAQEGWYDVWIKYEYPVDQPLGQSFVRRMVPHTYLDCKKAQAWITQVYFYAADGTLVTTSDLSKSRWQSPAPESNQETIITQGCALIRARLARNNTSR